MPFLFQKTRHKKFHEFAALHEYGDLDHICSAQCRNRDSSGIFQRKVGIPTLSADFGIVPDNSRIAQRKHVVLWSDMVRERERERERERNKSINLRKLNVW